MRLKPRHFLCVFIFSMLCSVSAAQNKFDLDPDGTNIQWGIMGGNTIHQFPLAKLTSEISYLNTQILSESYFSNYTLGQRLKNGKQYGLFFNIQDNSIYPVALYLEMASSDQEADLDFENYEKKFGYTMQFKYIYLNFSGFFRIYPAMKASGTAFHGVYAGIGYVVGINTNRQEIKYISRGPGYLPAFGTDAQQETQLRNVLKGQNDKGLAVEVGYKVPFCPVEIGIRYHWGTADLVRVEANSYNFIEKQNQIRIVQGNIKIDIGSFFKK